MDQQAFKARHHIPKFSRILAKTLMTPILIYFALAGNFLTATAAAVFYHLEKQLNPNVSSYWDALWWALCTISTVGYGDIVPMTGAGRIVAFLLIVTGVGFFMGYMAILVSVMSTLIAEDQSGP